MPTVTIEVRQVIRKEVTPAEFVENHLVECRFWKDDGQWFLDMYRNDPGSSLLMRAATIPITEAEYNRLRAVDDTAMRAFINDNLSRVEEI